MIDARFETPGVAAAFAAAHQVVEFTFTSGRQAAVPLETRGAVAAFDPATGRVTLSASTQMPHLLRTGIADALGIPESELRVVAPEVGGGFGQKMPLIPEYVVAVWAARRFACTVAWIEDRLENLTASFHARDQRLHLRGAFDADGQIARDRRRYPLQCRCLFEFPGNLWGRAVDGADGHARALPGARVPRPRPRRRQQHLPDGALSRRVAARHHRGDGAADGLRGRPARARYARNQAPQPDHRVSAYLGDRRRARPRQLSRGDGGCGAGRRLSPSSARDSKRRAPMGAGSASGCRYSQSAPAPALPPLRRGAW